MHFLAHPFAAMGTPCEVQLYAASAGQAAALAAQLEAEVRRLEQRYSRYREDSELAAINRVAANGGSIEVDAETAGLLDYAAACHAQSDGLFDITSGLLRQVWRFGTEGSTTLPDPALLAALLQRIGWQRLVWQRPQLHFPTPGMALDLGGIVKEYAADRGAALAQAAGCQHGLINLGGDVRVIGPHPDGSPWRIGIRDPRQPDTLLSTVELHSGALASSGDYERCVVIDGVRYGHLLNPRSGWPVRGLTAVSVAAPLCVVAGSAATIALLRGREGADWLAAQGLPHLWVDENGEHGGLQLFT